MKSAARGGGDGTDEGRGLALRLPCWLVEENAFTGCGGCGCGCGGCNGCGGMRF